MSDFEEQLQTVTVSINGAHFHLTEPHIADALVHVGVPAGAPHVAIAVNDAVVPRAAWAGFTLQSGDRIEIITAVAGG